MYDSEIFIKIKRKYQATVKGKLETNTAQIRQDIRTLIGSADPKYLREPTLATITRQIKAKLDEYFGVDEDGNSIVQDVIITRFTQINADL